MNPVIVVVTYNRVKPLQRLLESLSNADYSGFESLTLIISIDKGENNSVAEIANNFRPYGEKIVLQNKQRLGLRKHIIQCGDLAKKYGSIILLEDDLYVSPYFYEYAVEALAYYGSDDSISGISLYSHKINELAERIFEPISDGYDVFFLKRPSSWGRHGPVSSGLNLGSGMEMIFLLR